MNPLSELIRLTAMITVFLRHFNSTFLPKSMKNHEIKIVNYCFLNKNCKNKDQNKISSKSKNNSKYEIVYQDFCHYYYLI